MPYGFRLLFAVKKYHCVKMNKKLTEWFVQNPKLDNNNNKITAV